MSGYRRIRGARPLLFERLRETIGEALPNNPGATQGSGMLHDEDALRGSIAGALSDLFNTRVPLPIEVLEQRERSAIDYGIPDLSAFPVGENEAIARLARHLRDAIAAYEPRLMDPSIAIERVPRRPRTLIAVVRGTIEIHMMRRPVVFELPLETATATTDAG